MADARKDRRTLLSVKIRYKSATLEDFIERYSNDISRGGVFIKAKKPLAVGTLLKFEFLLQDQSTLIHGVGRVVWRRDESEADSDNPAGMGIKFIKMDPESRSVVQRIVEDRGVPGVFDQGKDGIRVEAPASSDPAALGGGDETKVRHVSEFLASALEEGGAGQAATSAARAGVEQARQQSSDLHDRRAAARGAFSAFREAAAERRRSASEGPSRGAMSAFGGSTASAHSGRRSSAAPVLSDIDDDDDFLDEETTKVKELPASDYPDADATAVARDISPFLRERRPTPVVPMASRSSSPLEEAVPDLFGPADTDSFGPAPGEFIDPSLLDPAVPTVPPRAATVPEPTSSADQVFQVPKPAPTVSDPARAAEKRKTRGWLALLLLLILLMAAAVAALRLGLLDGWIEQVAPGFAVSRGIDPVPALPVLAAQPPGSPADSRALPDEQPVAPQERPAQAPATESSAPTKPSEPATTATNEAPARARTVKFEVSSIPRGAYVSVNGEGVGRTPVTLEKEVGSELSIFSKARGFLPRRERVVVKADQEPVKLVLPALPYVVEVATDPPGARVSIAGGGEAVAPASLELTSMSGSRRVVISKDGYKTVTRSLSRRSFVEEPRRMAAIISVALEREGAARASEDPIDASAVLDTPQAELAPPADPAAEEPADQPAGPSETPAADAP